MLRIVVEVDRPPGHGEWLPVDELNDAFDCSECGAMVKKKHNFCPNCGADMREGGYAANRR